MVDTIFILNRNKEVIEVLSNNGAFPDAPFFDDTYVQILDTGAETYDFSTFSNTRTSNALVEGNYVLFCYDNKYKLFQIIETADEHTSTGKILTCHCEIAGLELLTDYCEPFKIEGNAITFFNTVLQDTNWNVGKYSASLETNIQSVKCEGNQKVYTVIQENLSKFGGIEIEYRVEFKGNILIGFFIDIYDNGQRGNKVYNRFEYGENIKGITRQKSLQDFASASIGEGKNGLNFKDIEWRLEWGNPADKPLGQNFVVDIEANNLYNKHGKYIKDVYKSDTEDARTLLEETWEHLQEVKKPKTDYEVDLGVTNSEYENMRIGDTNYVLDFDYNPPMLLSARIGKLELSFSDYTKNKCTLSNYKELKSFLHSEDRIDEIISSYFPITGEFIDKEAIGEEHIKTTYIQKLKTDIIEAGLVEVKVLIADKADIKDLGVLNASIEYLKAHKADIEVLNAAMGNIDTLTSKLADIETLVNGNLTSDNIHSLILTSSKVTVENGFIKNAMIESLSATKINTGILNTNLVNIQSEDGSLTLKGNLQQFKDKNGKVRIQMGKDATGNFTFAIFDETGTGTLIDSTGVKAKAIGNGIIVNDMISNNAGISGNKLDINSVVTSINNGTTNISGTKIQLNEKKQTLEVAFNSMSSTVTEHEKTIGSHNTSIEALKGQIKTLISDTTIVEGGNNIKIKDAFSSLKQEVGTISSKVSQVESDFDDVNANVQITVKSVKPQYYLSTSTTSCVGGTWQDTSPTWTQGKYMWQRLHYTYVNGTTSTGKETCIAGAVGDKGETGATGAVGQSVTSITPQYVAHTSSTTAPTSGWSDSCPAYSAGKFLWTRSKVIYANPSATKYTNPVYEPSWEAKNIADSASKTVTTKVAEFTQNLDGFKLEVSKTYYNKNEIDGKGYQTSSQIQQIVNGLEIKIQESGGYNLFRNSLFQNRSIDQWWYWGNANTYHDVSYFKETGDMWFGVAADNAGGLWQNGHELEPNTEYTLSVKIGWEYNVKEVKFVIEYTPDAENNGNKITSQHFGFKNDDTLRQSITFTTPSNIRYAKMGFWHGGSSDGGNAFLIHINKPCLAKGIASVWSPNPDEVYSGITSVDRDGIKVQHETGAFSRFDVKEMFQSNENGDRTISMRNGGLRTYQFNKDGNMASGFLGGLSSARNNYDGVYGNSIFGSSNCGFIDLCFTESGEDNQHRSLAPWLRCVHYDGNTGNLQGIHTYKNLYVRNWSHFYYRPQMYYGMDFPYENRDDLNAEKSFIGLSGNASPGTRRLYINGADGVQLLVQNGGDRIGHQILEEASEVGLYHEAWGNWNFNGGSLNNARVTYSLSNPIAKISSKERRFTRESEAIMSTSKLIQDRGEDFTMDGQCIVEIPDDIKYNIGRYDVNIIKYGRGDIWVSERNHDYFIVESDNDIKFTWVLEGELLENTYRVATYNELLNFGEGQEEPTSTDITESIPASKYAVMDDEQIEYETYLNYLKENNQLWKLYEVGK